MVEGGASADAGGATRFSRRTVLKGALVAQAAWVAPTLVVVRPDPALAGSAPPTTAVQPRREVRVPARQSPGTGTASGEPHVEQAEVLASTGGASALLTGLGVASVTAGAATIAHERRRRGGDSAVELGELE